MGLNRMATGGNPIPADGAVAGRMDYASENGYSSLWGCFMVVNNCLLCISLTFSCCLLISCTPSTETILDSESRRPIQDALVHAYSHEIITLGSRQRLYKTNEEGQAKVYVSGTVSLWAGKKGYYPLYSRTHSKRSIFSFWKPPFTPLVLQLNKVQTGDMDEVKQIRNHQGLMFYPNNPPCDYEFIQLLRYSHWVYGNTRFYDDSPSSNVLEKFFCEKGFPLKVQE